MGETAFGELLRQKREEHKLSVRDCAERARVSEKTYRKWESGREMPTSFQVRRVFGQSSGLYHYLPRATPIEAPAPSSPTFGEALRALRSAADLTQEELGELVGNGVTGQAVSAWETDKANPVREHYSKLVDLLPELTGAPTPDWQDIPPPDGGKKIGRDPMLRNHTFTSLPGLAPEVVDLAPHVEPPTRTMPAPTIEDMTDGSFETMREPRTIEWLIGVARSAYPNVDVIVRISVPACPRPGASSMTLELVVDEGGYESVRHVAGCEKLSDGIARIANEMRAIFEAKLLKLTAEQLEIQRIVSAIAR